MKSLRLAVLGLAALASTATSDIEEEYGYRAIEATPIDGAIDVSPDVIPEMGLFRNVEDFPTPPDLAWLRLQTAAGTEVAGTRERIGGSGETFFFVPDAPLPDGDYVLVLAPDVHIETSTSQIVALDDGRLAVRFSVSSTVSLTSHDLQEGARVIYLRFSQPIVRASIAEHLILAGTDGQPLEATVHELEPTLFTVVAEQPIGIVTLDAGVVAVDGRPVRDLPVSF